MVDATVDISVCLETLVCFFALEIGQYIYLSICKEKFFPSVTSHIGHWLTTVDDGHNA
jgi:hypothetical protein